MMDAETGKPLAIVDGSKTTTSSTASRKVRIEPATAAIRHACAGNRGTPSSEPSTFVASSASAVPNGRKVMRSSRLSSTKVVIRTYRISSATIATAPTSIRNM